VLSRKKLPNHSLNRTLRQRRSRAVRSPPLSSVLKSARIDIDHGTPFGYYMNDERITVRVTTTGQTLDVVVFSKHIEVIEVVLGEGVHSVRCRLTPTRNGMAYVGNVMGREIVYERARDQVKADLERANAVVGFKRR
jgi:hypothetical protein